MTHRVLATAIASILFPIVAHGQDVQPRAFTPAPVGINMLTLVYTYSTGEVLFDKTLPVENVEGDIHGINLAYSRSFGLLGMSGRADIVAPFVDGDWVGDITINNTKSADETRSRTGFADPTIRVALYFVGAPAMTRVEFATYRPGTVVGGILRMRVPLGQYDSGQALNLGSNRWSISPQFGISHVTGRFLFEAHAAIWLFTDNNEFLETSTQAQDPLYSFQVHVGYLTRRGLWVALSSRQSLGGATRVDNAEEVTREANNRVGLTLAVPVGARYTLKFLATTGITATVGNNYDTFGGGISVVL
jgi:hypothetical protein